MYESLGRCINTCTMCLSIYLCMYDLSFILQICRWTRTQFHDGWRLFATRYAVYITFCITCNWANRIKIYLHGGILFQSSILYCFFKYFVLTALFVLTAFNANRRLVSLTFTMDDFESQLNSRCHWPRELCQQSKNTLHSKNYAYTPNNAIKRDSMPHWTLFIYGFEPKISSGIFTLSPPQYELPSIVRFFKWTF